MGRLFKVVFLLLLVGAAAAGYMGVRAMLVSSARDIPVPDLRGLSVMEAMREAQRRGFTVKVDREVPSSAPAGVVVEQDPPPGTTVRQGRAIGVSVSRSTLRAPLPDVRGMVYEDAVRKLQEEGFVVGDVLRVEDPRAPVGVVVAQSPASPASVPRGSRVDLLLSLGQPGDGSQVEVPDVLGQPLEAARSVIERSGLSVYRVVEERTDRSPAGVVVRVWPRPGTRVARGSGISLGVSTGTPAPQPSQVSPQPGPSVAVGPRPEESSLVVTTSPSSAQGLVVGAPPASPEVGAPRSQEVSAVAPSQSSQPQAEPARPEPRPTKVARIRYQMPPVNRPMEVKISVVDRSGERVIYQREHKGGDYIRIDHPYEGEIAVQIYLGGVFVWEDRFM